MLGAYSFCTKMVPVKPLAQILYCIRILETELYSKLREGPASMGFVGEWVDWRCTFKSSLLLQKRRTDFHTGRSENRSHTGCVATHST